MIIRKRSLDEINYQFQSVLDRLGIDDDEQIKMKNISLDLKMKVIISLDSQCSKEQNIKVFLENLKLRNSLLNILSLKSIMNEGHITYLVVFRENDGFRILEDLTYKILFETEQIYDTNKALYEKVHCENIKERGPCWYDKGFNMEYDFQMYYAIGKKKNMCECLLMEGSRESMLNEVLGCMLVIAERFDCYEFDIARIVKNVYLFVYTQNFYNLIDLYAENCIERLDFLFKSEKKHCCVINTYFFDIYRENHRYKAIELFLSDIKYKKIVLFILSEIRNEGKKRPMNNETSLYEKSTNKNRLEYNQHYGTKIQRNREEMDGTLQKINTKVYNNSIDVNDKELDEIKAETKSKLNKIIENIENDKLIGIIPCFLESFIANPDTFDKKTDTLGLTKENENLKKEIERQKREIERLQLAVVNMDNKTKPCFSTKTIEEVNLAVEPKKIEVAVEEKLNNMTVKPKKMPFKKKSVPKETNTLLVPYTKKTYYPLRWSKTVKNSNIWDEVNRDMSYENLTQIFTVDDLSCYEKRLNTINKQGKVITKVRTIFSSKKGQAISIALGRVKMTDQEIKMYIFQLKECKFGENMIRQLVKNYPKKEEFELLKALKLEMDIKPELVGRAEQFYFEFLFCQDELYRYLTAIYFKISYPPNAGTIREMISKLAKIYTRALESKSIKEFCQYTLFVGNVFNNNTFSGNAEGFSFESIASIVEYTGNNKERLIEDVISKMQYDLVADLKYLTTENIRYDGLCIQFTDLLADYELITLNEEIGNYLKPLIDDFEDLKKSYKELNNLYAKFNKYFNGENVFEIFSMLLIEIKKKK